MGWQGWTWIRRGGYREVGEAVESVGAVAEVEEEGGGLLAVDGGGCGLGGG